MNKKHYNRGFEPTFHHDALDLPSKWKSPKLVFVNSMSDVFHDAFSDAQIHAVFEAMMASNHHTYQVLTKRPERMARMASGLPLGAHIWLGTSMENQAASSRIEHLVKTGHDRLFLSCEPLLGAIDTDLAAVDLVIVEGEPVAGARPIHPDWARSLRDLCAHIEIDFYSKQWGQYRYPSLADLEAGLVPRDRWPSRRTIRVEAESKAVWAKQAATWDEMRQHLADGRVVAVARAEPTVG
jgi:protein gp37